MSQVLRAPACRGFDCNTALTIREAELFRRAGYSFAVRYIKRSIQHSYDLTRVEVANLHNAGLAVMPVQHVESDSSWFPDATKGRIYGASAVAHCLELRVPAGVTVWLDLEGVNKSVSAEQIIRYCNYWHDTVAAIGYHPGIYVGWHAGLSPEQLYKRLKFTRYWAAYNLNRDEYPAVRGICMKQGTGPSPAGVNFQIDTNTIIGDRLKGYPNLWAPDEWTPQ